MRTVRPALVAGTATLALVAFALAASSPPPRSATVPPAQFAAVAAAEVRSALTPPVPAGVSVVDPFGVVSRSTVTPASDVGDIPVVALLAYQRAASIVSEVDRSCGITWTVLAALGRVESDHGRTGGAVLGDDGVSTPAIRGVALDGRGPVARIRDTDAGVVDGDRRWDRAVGPMQILPSTWAAVGVDADGDGVRSADDLDDAALGAAVFLCAAPGDLTTLSGLRTAIHRYNPSNAYVDEVLAVERRYRAGGYGVPGGPAYGDPTVSVRALAALPSSAQPALQDGTGEHHAQHAPHHGDPVAPVPPPTTGPTPDPTTPGPTTPGPTTPGPTTPGPTTPGPTTPDPTTPGPTTPDPTTPGPTTPDPTTPGPTTPDPTTPGPTTPGPATPETRTGVLTDCGTAAEPAWCLDETTLDVGDADYLAGTALGDFDGDGTVETNTAELTGLVDTEITVAVTTTAGEPPVLLAIGDLGYVAPEGH
jgi:hypothetical protein